MSFPSPISFPKELPISQRAEEILAAINDHQVIVLSGETGSGKTTQIPKMCLAAGRGAKRKIACTQPRRVAALSVAKRVAEELNVDFGNEVGAKIRFTDKTSKNTRIKFMTDGMLLAEVQSDRRLQEYDTIIIDEAHERSLNIDFLLGHLNKLRQERPDLKIIITSATIDVDKFSRAFDGAPIIEVSGRVYPVDVIYAPLDELLEDTGDFTFVDGIAESVDRIVEDLGHGDILAFLPTEKDIREAMDLLHGRVGKHITILPCFGRLSNADQQKIFSRSPKRKLILATNIAETSLTIPGIRFVIDAGLARLSRYNPRTRTKRLPIEKVSQSSANQRKGRCGRVADGICIRLYSETDFDKRPVYSIPELQRSNLAEVILRMKASRLGEVETFPFIDPPSPAAIKAGYQLLEELGAIQPQSPKPNKNNPQSTIRNPQSPKPNPQFGLTQLGRKLASLPIDPTVGRMLLQAEDEGCVEAALVIASALSIQDPKERPLGKEEAANQAHKTFLHRDSDFLTLLNIWESVHNEVERLSQSKLRKFCKQNFLSYLRMREWKDVYDQLHQALRDYEKKQRKRKNAGSPLAGEKQIPPSNQPSRFTYTDQKQKDSSRAYGGSEYAAIHHCLITGLLANPARKEQPNHYKAGGDRKVMIFPGSTLFNKKALYQKGKKPQNAKPSKIPSPEWILSGEIVETNRIYARNVATIDPTWLVQLGQHIIKRRYSEPNWDPKQGRATVKERIILHGLEIQNKHVSYAKVNPKAASEIFIRQGLLDEDFHCVHDFLEHNRRLKRRIQNAQTTMEMASWIGIEESAYRFYEARLKNVASIDDLNRHLKTQGRAVSPRPPQSPPSHPPKKSPPSPNPPQPSPSSSLFMTETDLMPEVHAPVDLDAFPAKVTLQNSALPIDYSYNPGKEDDGVTLKLPYSKAREVDNPMLDWLIPGHLEIKIHHLLKALPKDTRRQLLPLADTAKTLSKKIRPTGQTLPESLAQYLKTEYGIETYASDWNADAVPSHLKVRLQVEDAKGEVIASARDAQELAQKLDEREQALSKKNDGNTAPQWQKARQQFERPIETLADLAQWRKHPTIAPALKVENSTSSASLPPIDLNPSTSGRGLPILAYPALRKTGNILRIHLFNTESDALKSNRIGIADLIENELRYELAWIRKDLKEVRKIGPTLAAFGNIEAIMEDAFERIRLELADHTLETLDPKAIATAAAKAKEKSKGILYKLVDAAKAALELRQELVVRKDLYPDLRNQLDRLVPKNFIRFTPFWALERLPQYLRVIEKRQRVRPQSPERDAKREREVETFRDRFKHLPSDFQNSPQGVKLKWTIEEFSLSIHAQELGTAFPISAKRLKTQFAEIDPESEGQLSKANPPTQSAKSPAPQATPKPKPIDRPTSADLESLKNLFE